MAGDLPNGTSASSHQEGGFPHVVLDTTLYDLYKAEYPEHNGEVPETLCHFKPNADRRYREIPLNNKFLITSSNVASGSDLAHLQLENVSNLLMFPIGRGKVAYVASEGISDDPSLSRESVDAAANRGFMILPENQRPIITTHANADDFIANHDGSPIRWGFSVDFAEKLPALLPPEKVFEINSKRWLAVCGLRNANDKIIDCQCLCESHTTEAGDWYYGQSDCTACNETVSGEIARVLKVLEETPVPYVLKLTQSLGSVGTHIVKDEEDRKKTIEYMSTDNLPAYLPRISEHNAHIWPTALVVSEFIKGDTMALNFFIKKDGSPIFVCACQQLTTRTSDSGRQSTGIIFAEQEEMEKKYYDTLCEIGKVLRNEGYFGQVGADIMEDPDTGTQYVIDLNVRTPTSYTLGLIKGHCKKRGFGVGIIYECVILKVSREDLEEKFHKEFEEGRIILLGCTRLGTKDAWAYPTILVGEEKEDIDKLSARIMKLEVGGEESEAGAG